MKDKNEIREIRNIFIFEMFLLLNEFSNIECLTRVKSHTYFTRIFFQSFDYTTNIKNLDGLFQALQFFLVKQM